SFGGHPVLCRDRHSSSSRRSQRCHSASAKGRGASERQLALSEPTEAESRIDRRTRSSEREIDMQHAYWNDWYFGWGST
ncbi:MAG: hypothetical protein M3Y67_07675, partial [Pseudomonadota bacterium]|nr:hypothetical protein [Pseudomonadota bacterium]